MKPVVGGWNLLVIGRWDALVFTPEWLKDHVARGKVTVAVGGVPGAPPRVSFDGVELSPHGGRLVAAPVTIDDAALASAERVVLKILAALPHTPVHATGVNLQFTVPAEGRIAAVLELPDTPGLAAAGHPVGWTSVRRRLGGDAHSSLNLTLETQRDGCMVGLNYHAEVSSTRQAAETLKGSFVARKHDAVALLTKLYGG